MRSATSFLTVRLALLSICFSSLAQSSCDNDVDVADAENLADAEDVLDAEDLVVESDSLPNDLDDGDRADDIIDNDGSASSEADRLVVVTLNTHSFQEGDDSLDKLTWIGEGLAALEADLVGLNEVMSGTFWSYDYNGAEYDGTEMIRSALETASGETYYDARHGFGYWADGEEMSNVLLSRYPIVESGHRLLTTTDFWPAPEGQRAVLYARVTVPGVGGVNVFVTHTWGWDSADRLAQVDEVKAYMEDLRKSDVALDLLLGDLNSPPTYAAYDRWLTGPPIELIDTYSLANPAGHLDSTSLDGDFRIDYILAGAGWGISDDPDRYTSTIIFDGNEVAGTTLPVVSDHKGVMTVFSVAVE